MRALPLLTAMLFITLQGFSQESEFDWLVGTWKRAGKTIYETWKRADDGSLAGLSFRINGSDTVTMEVIKIVYERGAFHYIPDIAGPQGPIDFRVTQYDENGFVAENPQHDFPKLIRYRLVVEASGQRIEAAIEGDGKVIPFHYDRVTGRP